MPCSCPVAIGAARVHFQQLTSLASLASLARPGAYLQHRARPAVSCKGNNLCQSLPGLAVEVAWVDQWYQW